ncbi:MAG: DNA alkylation repair protein [Fibromonadaceae bacterium]|jgi:3-methyladenine DNA glycosylase AlkC|nr:DNA alkylation repair protein [Fibromonadaceae bacterium]
MAVTTCMPDSYKNMYNHNSLREFALIIQSAYKPFKVDEFLKSTMDENWDSLELKARWLQIATNMGKYLPADYKKAIGILDKIAAKQSEMFAILFPCFVEVYGQDEENWDLSINALERYTVYSSSEFAVRPFIIKNKKRMMAKMYEWSKHENEHVRRLASEGCRPALPWGQALVKFKKDPAPILPILEKLKTDPSLYVRKSVANNLNDISKTHPDLVAKLAKKWYGKNEYTNWIVKHGCRTLLKKANPEVMAIFGFDDVNSVEVNDFALETTSVSFGGDIMFSFAVSVKEAAKVRLEYGIDYVKANGKRNRKIFQISEISLKANEKKFYTKKHSLAEITTRKHYPGLHSIALVVNGAERGKLDFELDSPRPLTEETNAISVWDI